ncbi:VanZ family protein [Enterococcus mundtii]|uniref:VanZ-like domain-containing protein n=1 Tax=Enterococcus mundtii TaxID=53346 RepID=A0A1V2UBL1_ENTMU|nr:hypothetical protein BTN92_14505 [Enterococcus mundtii]
MIIITLFLYVSLHCAFTRNIYREWLVFFSLLYITFLIYLLFLKNIGIRGVVFQLFSWVKDLIYGDPMIVLFNILLFLPLGWILPVSWKNTILVLSAVLGVEWIQYFFYLGIFDLGDVFVNTCGFLIGTCINRWLISRWDIQVFLFYISNLLYVLANKKRANESIIRRLFFCLVLYLSRCFHFRNLPLFDVDHQDA